MYILYVLVMDTRSSFITDCKLHMVQSHPNKEKPAHPNQSYALTNYNNFSRGELNLIFLLKINEQVDYSSWAHIFQNWVPSYNPSPSPMQILQVYHWSEFATVQVWATDYFSRAWTCPILCLLRRQPLLSVCFSFMLHVIFYLNCLTSW